MLQSSSVSNSASFTRHIFERVDEWGDDDSAELVIGLSDAQPDSYAELMDLITGKGGEVVNTVSMGGEIWAVVAEVPFEAFSSFVEETQATGLSRYIEPNMRFQADFVPNDPFWPLQWGPRVIEADWAWNTTMGDPAALVAVIDTGIDYDHPDLATNYVALGYDWVNDDPDPMDDNGHGTHCAGIIAAVLNNSVGTAGLAQVRIMAEKGLNASGYGWEDDLAYAIIHAVDQGADILSLSWGSYAESALIYDALIYAYDAGVLVIAAAGSDATSVEHYPAAYDEVVAVTATDEYEHPWSDTNFGDWVELAAPGVNIYSTMPRYHVTMNDEGYAQNYDNCSGTSMACPHVSGVAALMLSQFPGMTGNQLRLQLRDTADDLGDPGFDQYYGYGRINARRAVEELGVVVFEEAHLPTYTIGTNPAYEVTGGYAEFADYLAAHASRRWGIVSTIDPGTIIDSEVLAPVDILVIVAPMDDYLTPEIDAIEKWVEGGGSLLLISDRNDFALQASTIAARFDIDLAEDIVYDSDENVGGNAHWPYYDGANLLTHAITTGVTRVEMYAGDGIIGTPANEIPLIVTDSDGTAYWYDDSPALGVSVMSAIEGGTAGSGRLVIIADCGLWSKTDSDGDGEINFYDSDNEILALNTIDWLAACGFADLKITDVYPEPPETMPGDDVTFYADVENQGTENATDFVVELYLDEQLYASATSSLAAGANTTYKNTYPWTATTGNHTVRWVIDATNVIDESNEDNNEMSDPFRVGGVELYYDDGTAEIGWAWSGAGPMYAVRFTPPVSGQLIECSFYIYSDPDTINVHILDTDKNDMITPFPETPTSTGWFHVDLSTYGITVSPDVDFYVAMEYTAVYAPYLGTDTDDPDNRSWWYNGTEWFLYDEGDYMIRAVIAGVDLKITDVRLEPYPLKRGDDVTFYADVENQGTENATDFVVALYLDEQLYASATSSLAAGANTTYKNTYPWNATLGNHTVRWVIDATNVIDESNEDNNEMSETFTVGHLLTVQTPYGTPSGEGWYDNCTTAYATLDTDIVDHGNGTRRVFTHWSGDASGTNYAQSDPIHMDGPKTATANWKTQYRVTFAQTGLDSTATGTVLTVNGDTKTFLDFPNTTWVDAGGSISYSYSGTVSSSTSGERFSLVDVTGPDSPISVTGPATVTGNYKTQYYLTMSTNFGTATPGSGWHDAESTVQIGTSAPGVVDSERYVWLGWTGTGSGSYSSTDNPASIIMNGPINETAAWRHEYYLTVTSPYGSPTPESGWFEAWESITSSVTSPWPGTTNTQFVCTGWTGTGSVPESGSAASVPFTINEPSSITWTWKAQYLVTFAYTGLDDTATGTVVTVDGDMKTFSDLPNATWVDNGDSISYSHSDPVSSSVGGKRFKLVDVTGPASPITVTGSVTVTGNYEAQYQVTFDQSGVGADFTGTVVTIDGSVYTVTDLPFSFWWDANSSHDFAFQSPLVVTPDGKRYVWASTSGLSSLQSGSITVSASGTIIGNYGTQYCLTVTSPYDSTTPSSGWFDDRDEITASVTSPWPGATGVRYVCTGWTGTGSVSTSGSTTSVTFTIDKPSSVTWNWKTQYLLTISTDPTGLSPQPDVSPPGPWYDGGTLVTCTAQGISEHEFDQWTVDETDRGSDVNSIAVTMDSPHIAIAIYHFTLHKPISWLDYITRPEIIGLLIALFSAICTVAAFVATRRKRGRVREMLNEIDDAYFRYKKNARRCEAELYRLKDVVLEQYKSGDIIESSFNILNKRINDYIKEIREQNK